MAIPCTPQYIVIPVKDHGQNEYQSWPYLSPIDWLEKLMIDNRDALVPDPSSIKDFWTKWLKDHPLDGIPRQQLAAGENHTATIVGG